MQGVVAIDKDDSSCANCGNPGSKKCSRCKSVRYCSSECQAAHWRSGHKSKCKDNAKVNTSQSSKINRSVAGIALVPATGASNPIKKPREVLFPYEVFIELYEWEKRVFPPCGLLNYGNSCFANVVLQCLTYTRPLIAYLLEKGHRKECRQNDWCFLCELEAHVERASRTSHAFSPINILSHLPNIGGNLGHGRQEDAHEFMRFAVDRMQSVCLDEFGGEKAVSPTSQETTLIQHIFGGHLQSQVICTKCNKISNQFENIMDLAVEIHGDATSLEECLDQFTVKEWLHGDNMYKCDGCNDYVQASKQLTIKWAPNILTIALKRFQSGRFGKLNKRVAFPETLDLSPFMSGGDGTDIYTLYAVVVHVDMLNASFFGHYICYSKDFHGNWYRIDDSKVSRVELEDVLSQSAYMLLYNRVSVRSTCLRTTEPSEDQVPSANMDKELSTRGASNLLELEPKIVTSTFESQATESDVVVVTKPPETGLVNVDSNSVVSKDVTSNEVESYPSVDSEAIRDFQRSENIDSVFWTISDGGTSVMMVNHITDVENPESMDLIDSNASLPSSMEIADCDEASSEAINSKSITVENLGKTDVFYTNGNDESTICTKMNSNVHALSREKTPIRQRS